MHSSVTLTFLTFLLLGQAFSQGFHSTTTTPKLRYSSSISRNHRRFFIRYNSRSSSSSNSDNLKQNNANLRSQLARLNIKTTDEKIFGDLFEGISLQLANPADLAKLSQISIIKEIIPVQSHSRPSVFRKNIPDMALKYTHGVTGVAKTRLLGYKGRGIKVAILDSGVDYTHPDLGGCLGPGCKVEFGYNFAYKQDGGKELDPMDCNGHGTHVAGIIAASGKNFTGVAPNVTLGAYKIFSCNESMVEDDLVIQALERAKSDGMQIINLSLGFPSGWTGHPLSIAVEKLTSQGIHVFSAAGNSGSEGLWEVSAPSIASKSFSIASFDNYRYMAHVFQVDGKDGLYDYFNSDALSFNFSSSPLVSAFNGDDDLACNGFKNATFDGKIVLVQRGNCSWNEKMLNVKKAGGIASIYYNDEIGPLYGIVTERNSTPVACITQENGLKLLSLINNSSVNITFLNGAHPFDNPYGGKVSAFSSWGPGPLLEQKPDLGAPGGLIYSTYPVANGSYITFSGTSMSTPYAAGAAALYLEAKGNTPPQELLDVFRQTAVPALVFGTKNYTPIQHQGAGLINVYNALNSTSQVTPTRIQLLSDDLESEWTRDIVVKNNGKEVQTYSAKHYPALSIQPWDLKMQELSQRPQTVPSMVKLAITPVEFSLSPGQTKTVRLRFSKKAPVGQKQVFGGYVRIIPRSTKHGIPVQVTYSGMFGNYKDISLFPIKPTVAIPCLFDAKKGSTVNSNETATYALGEEDPLVLFYSLLHPAKKVRVILLDATTDQEVALITNSESTELGRNDYLNSPISIFNWMGEISTANNTLVATGGGAAAAAVGGNNGTARITNGRYRLKFQALPPFASESVASDWQNWTSPMFIVNSTNATESEPRSGEERTEAALKAMLNLSKKYRRTKNIESSSTAAVENSVMIRPFSVAASFE